MRREGAAFHGKFMLLSVLRREPSSATRVGFITSSRVGGAVERNRVRRRLREIVRVALPRLQCGAWLVIVARRRAVEATFAELRTEWETLEGRAAAHLSKA